MQLTYYGANSWLLEFESLRILIDPWLVETLTFGGQAWLFEGSHRHPITIPDNIDLILLSQGLEDHTHRPTLAKLSKQIPVVASVSAAAIAQQLGFLNISPLKPGETYELESPNGLGGQLQIRATKGAPVPQVENGYVIQGQASGKTLYYEPHGYGDPVLAQYSPIDVVITPIVDLGLPLVGAIVRGGDRTAQLLETVQARYILPTAAGGAIAYSGILDKLLQTQGDAEEFRRRLQTRGLATELLIPKDQETLTIAA
ncbi:MAG: MBL fold metallo-hydrolase [Synechococcales cyanobacterium RM1_1_8]|nr:MBL fold metallo-hydrolase [Synechococcales cyanobacterium RM1_1_8]